jgi:hypothetical protein
MKMDPKKRIEAWEKGRESYEYSEPEVEVTYDKRKKKGLLGRLGERIKQASAERKEARKEETEAYKKALKIERLKAAKRRGEERAKAVYEPKKIKAFKPLKMTAHPFAPRLFASEVGGRIPKSDFDIVGKGFEMPKFDLPKVGLPSYNLKGTGFDLPKVGDFGFPAQRKTKRRKRKR